MIKLIHRPNSRNIKTVCRAQLECRLLFFTGQQRSELAEVDARAAFEERVFLRNRYDRTSREIDDSHLGTLVPFRGRDAVVGAWRDQTCRECLCTCVHSSPCSSSTHSLTFSACRQAAALLQEDATAPSAAAIDALHAHKGYGSDSHVLLRARVQLL